MEMVNKLKYKYILKYWKLVFAILNLNHEYPDIEFVSLNLKLEYSEPVFVI